MPNGSTAAPRGSVEVRTFLTGSILVLTERSRRLFGIHAKKPRHKNQHAYTPVMTAPATRPLVFLRFGVPNRNDLRGRVPSALFVRVRINVPASKGHATRCWLVVSDKPGSVAQYFVPTGYRNCATEPALSNHRGNGWHAPCPSLCYLGWGILPHDWAWHPCQAPEHPSRGVFGSPNPQRGPTRPP